ncbi:MAG: hypothetical protein Q8880_13740, partial [Bacteroidota bacterium]|nr:hypothetical protein [Bacteroidota bacterium]
SMGGYDIFKASWNDSLKNWNEPENLGYPINNSDDNMSIVMSKSGRYGYMSAFRDEGEGDLDIYRVTFNSVKPVETVVKGALLFNDTISNIYKKHQKFSNIKTNPSNEIEINVADRKGKKMGTYRPNRETGKYVMILPPGKYGISVKNENFQSYTDSIKVFGFGSYKPEITKNIILKSK